MKGIVEKEIARLILKYNVLACPKNGIPKLTPTGQVIKKGLKSKRIRKHAIKWIDEKKWICFCGKIGYDGVEDAKNHLVRIQKKISKGEIKIER